MPRLLDGENQTASSHEKVLIAPLATGGWRMCDGSVRTDDAAHVVAYVERVSRGFEVIWMSGARRRQVFGTWDAVVDAVARFVDAGASRGARPPIDIAHFAPPRG